MDINLCRNILIINRFDPDEACISSIEALH